MAKCNTCIHQHVCEAWIKHGTFLCNNFAYSIEDCQYYMATISAIDQMLETLNKHNKQK